MLSTGDLSHLEAALDVGIESLRRTGFRRSCLGPLPPTQWGPPKRKRQGRPRPLQTSVPMAPGDPLTGYANADNIETLGKDERIDPTGGDEAALMARLTW